uniref:Low-density lipoprotein receptor-related protein 6-like n=1 Tax=Phallusia mammillata TaxID=59560 RepID=A0A6F9DKE9_9ASCI|nr:low-density lipoprotein receptor-related protein 6-like [Phallusia mammillata]
MNTCLGLLLVLAFCHQTLQSGQECLSGPSVWYSGNQSTTNLGYTCQNWTAKSPHIPKYTPADGGNHNFCRNPDHDILGTWCYTTNSSKKWDYCNITKCPDDSLVIWTNVNQVNKTTQLYSLPADPEVVRRQSPSSKINVTVFVGSNPGTTAEFWAVASDYASKQIFFADYRTRYLGIYDQTTNDTSLYLEGMGHGIENIAYDWRNRNLYLTDSSMKWVLVADNQFQYYAPIHKADPDPAYGLALHSTKRFLFFSTYKLQGSKIIRTDLAGKNATTLFAYPEVHDVTGMTVDYADEKLYWTDFTGYGSLVMSSNFDGTNKTQKYYSGSSIYWGIASFNSILYVTDVHRRIDNTGALYYHLWWIPKGRNQKGRLNVGNYKLTGKPRGVTVMSRQTEQSPFDPVLVTGSCQASPECAHICLPRLNATRECICSIGYTKQGDTGCITNSVGTRYMLVSDAGQGKIFRVSLDNSSSNYSVFPMAQASKVTFMTNDGGAGSFVFWSDKQKQKIFKSTINGATARTLVDKVHARFLAFDPLDQNLFYIDDDTQYIAFADAINGYVTTIMKPDRAQRNKTSIRQLTLDLQMKKVYWTDTRSTNDQGQLWRMNYDGSQKEIVFDNLNWPHGITIDQKNRILYFTESKRSQIYGISLALLANVTGTIPTNRTFYNLKDGKRKNGIVTEIQVINDLIYFNDRTRNYMEVIDPSAANPGASPFGPRDFYRIRSMVYYDTSYFIQYINKLGRPCALKGCNSNCVALTRGTSKCLCQDGFNLVTSNLCTNDGTQRPDNPPSYGVTCPTSKIRVLPPCSNSTPFSWATPAWTDDFTATMNLTLTSPSITSPATLGPGFHEFSYTATDHSGNVGHCTFDFTVTQTQCRARQGLGTNIIETATICGDNGPEYNITCASANQLLQFGQDTRSYMTNRCFSSGEWMYPNLNGLQCVDAPTTAPTTLATTSRRTTTVQPTTTSRTSTTTSTGTTTIIIATTTHRPTTTAAPPATTTTAAAARTTTKKGPMKPTGKASTTSGKATTTATLAAKLTKGYAMSSGAIAAIVILVIVFVAVVAVVAVQYVRNGKRGVGMIIPVFWKPKEDTINLQNDTDDGGNHYSVL